MNYSKQALSFADQVAIIKSRGLTIQDDNLAIEYHKSISYFRIVGYLRPMVIFEAKKETWQKRLVILPAAPQLSFC